MKIKTNLAAGALCLAVSVIVWILIPYQIGEVAGGTITSDARLFPRMFTVLMGSLGIVLVVMSLVFHKEVIKEIKVNQEARVLGYYAIVFVFTILIPVCGFLIAAILFVAASLIYLKSRNKWHYIASVCVTIAVYLAFSKGLGVRF